jgi:hypothetical protein
MREERDGDRERWREIESYRYEEKKETRESKKYLIRANRGATVRKNHSHTGNYFTFEKSA